MDLTRRAFLKGAAAGAVSVAAMGIFGSTYAETAEQAGAGAANAEWPAWLGAPPAIPDTFAEEINVDVLVVGIGTTGNFAIPAAVEKGGRVLGISTAQTPMYGVSGVNSKYMVEAGYEMDEAMKTKFLNEFVHYAAGDVNPRLIRMWIDNSGETMNWYGERLEENGGSMYYKHIEKPDDNYRGWALAHTTISSSGELDFDFTMNSLQDYAKNLGAEYRYGLSLVQLLTDDIGICGAIAQYEETKEYVKINTKKGVILCSGGYHANEAMMRALQPTFWEDFSADNGTTFAKGVGIKAALWAGAALDPHQCSMIMDRGALYPDDGAGDFRHKEGSFFQMGSQPWLKVNLYGQRFTNESAPYDFILHSSDYFPGKCYCSIWDSNWYEHAMQFQTIGCSRFVPDEYDDNFGGLALVQMQLEAFEEMGYIVRADSYRELAQKLNILDPDEFVKTVEHYNELCDKGIDEDFGKEGYRMVKLDAPPYFGIRQSGCIGVTLSGVLIDEDMHVLDANRNPIPGLYAAGCDSGGYFAHTYYNLTDSASGGRCATQGRHAGQIAATEEREACLARHIIIG